MVFDVGGVVAWRCSGTLLSPTVMLTAGHCTYGASGGRVWFESDVEAGIPDNGYPYGGGTSIEFSDIHTHTFYQEPFTNDIGIVILSQPVELDQYGVLAPVGFIDTLTTARGLKGQIFNPVGYGLQSYVPELQVDRVRYTGEVLFVATKEDDYALFTSTPSNRASGGACFGDSGGPFLYSGTNVISAIVAKGAPNCIGVETSFRTDTPNAQEFINTFLD